MNSAVVDVRRAGQRFRTRLDWLDSRHSFSFGQHYDPANTHHGQLVVHNDDTVAAGGGFDTHPHRDMEILTWVLDGALVHQDSRGNHGVVYPGLAQTMSAGTGILHAERNDRQEPVRFVQMWVVPDDPGLTPEYRQALVDAGSLERGLVPVAAGTGSGRTGDAAIRINNRNASLYVARLAAGAAIELPEAPYLHLFIARGSVALEGTGPLAEGDAVRFAGAGGQRVTASVPAEVLVWEMHASLG